MTKKGEGRKGKDTIKTHVYPYCEGPNDAISTKFSTVVDLTYVMTYAHFGYYQFKGVYFAAVQNLPFSHDFNGWPYNVLP